ncbi:MAG: nitrate- and nitrite sensing domain-containing protein [Pseudohongiella sp.]|uniref:nitrate- and nitrite sensing domain-containing protein n=1 Tax=Pseudohongiella sp. TaxID=1979412 RepID=UPI0034A056E3
MERSNAADYLLRARYCEIKGLENFLVLSDLVSTTSSLIHELQRERGASNLVLGSAGARYVPELTALRAMADQQVQAFETVLKSLDQDHLQIPSASRFFSHIAYAVHLLSAVDQMRRQVDNNELTTVDCTDLYSAVVQSLLNIVFETADSALNAVISPALSRALVAIFNFIQGKELSGQERASGAAGFAAGQFSNKHVAHLAHLIEAQERCFEIFREFADNASLTDWNTLSTAPCMIEINELRHYACTQGNNPILNSTYAERWFTAQTLRIDAMKEIENSLHKNLATRCKEKLEEAREGLDINKMVIESLPQHGTGSEESFLLVRASILPAQTPGSNSGRSLIELLQSQSRRLQSMQGELDSARSALEERKVMDRAKLLLMKHRALTEEQAHRLLREMAMNQSRRLIDIARALCDSESNWR